MSDAQRDCVADELEAMCKPGAILGRDSPRATWQAFTPGQRVVRAAHIARAYLRRQENVSTDGAIAVVTAGPPGAGKTSFLLEEGYLDSDYRNIDPDEVKSLLLHRALDEGTFNDLLDIPLSDGLSIQPMELATLVHQESASIADSILRYCLEAGENVVLQGALGWDEYPNILLRALTKEDYSTLTILDVEVEETLALERSRERWWEGRHDPTDILGGRFVPEDVIRGLYAPSGRSRCEENAELMLVTSNIAETRLIRQSTVAGVTSRVVKTNTNSARRASEADLTDDAIDE